MHIQIREYDHNFNLVKFKDTNTGLRKRTWGQSEENDRETALISDSVPVRPEQSVQSAVVPAVIGNEDLDHKVTDGSLWHHNRVATRLCAAKTKSLEKQVVWFNCIR